MTDLNSKSVLVTGGSRGIGAAIAGAPHDLGAVVAALWQACDRALPDSDFTRVFEYLRDIET